jgi:hypothetical protein
MAKKAKRLVSEKLYTAIDCRRLLHIALFSTGTYPEPRSHRIPLREHLHHYAISALPGGAVRIFVAAFARCACDREVASSCGDLLAFSCVWCCGSRLGSTRTPR